MTRLIIVLLAVIASALAVPTPAYACVGLDCDEPEVAPGQGSFTAAYVERTAGGGWIASNNAPVEHPYTYQLSHPCVVDDRKTQTCSASNFRECPSPPDRVIEDLVIEQRRLVITDETGTGTTTADGFPAGTSPVGTPVGAWLHGPRGCIDITALNPAPSPAEVFRYFQTLPLPPLSTKQQPPGNGLVGLPVIFYTDGPTTQTFTLTIRGFTVDVVAGTTAFTWHTGDGAHLTAYLTTTWGATFRVNGGAPVAVSGTTTTDGPPVSFAVLQARPVLTNPYD
jgi:hypothetical protein